MSDTDAPRARIEHDPLVPYTADIWVRASRLLDLLRNAETLTTEATQDDETL